MAKPSKGTPATGSKMTMDDHVAAAMKADMAYDMAHHIVENSPADKKRDAAVRANAMKGK